MTIRDNTKPVDLLYENREPASDDEKILNQVDLRKVKPEVRFQEPYVEKEQYVLIGFSPKERLINDIRGIITDFQKRLRECVNETWDLMEHDPEENSTDYGDLQSSLAELIASTERAKRSISSDRPKRRSI
jgi:hypothetical protein